MRRTVLLALALAILVFVALVPPPAAAKVPFQAIVERVDTGEQIAVLEAEPNLVALIDALYGPNVAVVPGFAKPAAWDYRVVMYWDAALRHPTDLWYYAPRDSMPGIVYWPDAFNVGETFLVRSPNFDALMSAHGAGTPTDATVVRAPPVSWTPVLISAAFVAVAAATAVWRVRRRAAHTPD